MDIKRIKEEVKALSEATNELITPANNLVDVLDDKIRGGSDWLSELDETIEELHRTIHIFLGEEKPDDEGTSAGDPPAQTPT